MNGTSADGRGTQGTQRALWIFVAVAVLCVAQVSWWILHEVRQADQLAKLKQTQLNYRSAQIAIQLSDQISSLWDDLYKLTSDTAWTGSMPRRLMEHPFVLKHSALPTITRRIQSPFGSYELDNWTWGFYGPRDSTWIMLDPQAVAKAVDLIDTSFEFRGEAPFPGPMPYVLDPPPVRPKPAVEAQIEADRKQCLTLVGLESVAFLLLTLGGVYLIYRRT